MVKAEVFSNYFSFFFGTKFEVIEAFLNLNLDFSNVLYKNQFFGNRSW